MVWFFERNDESLRLETSYDKATQEYLLVVVQPDGSPQIERFSDAISFRTRLEALEKQLATDRWRPRGPTVLRDGW